jgi:hypothetical protein
VNVCGTELQKDERYKNSIYNYIPSESSTLERMAKEVEELYKRCKGGKDVEEGQKAWYICQNYLYYFKREIPGRQRAKFCLMLFVGSRREY